MKKFLISLMVLVFISNSAQSVTYNSDPEIFIAELVTDVITTLNDNSITEVDKNKIIEKIIVENVDIKVLGLYTLGKIRKELKPEDIEKYNNLFKRYLIKSLTSRLSDYTSQKFEIINSNQKSALTTIVSSKILEGSSQPEIKIDWRIYTKNPLKPLIRDLIVEGLSIAKVQKEEFSSVLNSNNNDINNLFSILEQFISE